MKFARIAAIEYHLPERSLDNDALASAHPDWGVAAIAPKLGVNRRFVAQDDETALDLAQKAVEKLLDSPAAIGAKEAVDAIIFCTQTPDYLMPPNSPLLQARVGLSRKALAFDITHGCSGYMYCLSLAKALIESGQASCVLAVTADTLSRYIHPDDRSVGMVFSDGAAATLLRAEESGEPDGTDGTGQSVKPFISDFAFTTDGRGWDKLIIPGSAARQGNVCLLAPEESEEPANTGLPGASGGLGKLGTLAKPEKPAGCENEAARALPQGCLFMDGLEILHFTMSAVPALVRRTLESAGLSVEQTDHVIFHQASKVVLDQLQRKLKIPADHFANNLAETGNTSAASIPIALKQLMESGKVKQGDMLLLAGFGVGYSGASCVVRV